MKDMIVLRDDTWSEGHALNSLFNSLGNIKWTYILRQTPNGLITASAERPFDIVFLPIGVFVEHGGEVRHLVMPDGLPASFHRLLNRVIIRQWITILIIYDSLLHGRLLRVIACVQGKLSRIGDLL